MIKRLKFLLATVLVITLAGCSLVEPAYQDNVDVNQPLGPTSTIGAVNSLVSQADAARNNGRDVQAVSLLERALKIEPVNAVIWHKLAGVRLLQQKWSQAEQLAAKSSSLPSPYPQLRAKNQQIIEQARRKRLRK